YEAQVGSAIESIKSTALDSDARVSFDRRSMLTEGEYESHTLRLSPDSVYDIWSVCDNDCGAMALRLSQPSRSEPLESATAAEPHLTFIPEAAGDYTIDADMWECGIGSCYYGLLVIARERQDLPAD